MPLSGAESVLGLSIMLGTPLLLAGIGELVAERSGVLNLGIEGVIAVGALISVVIAQVTGSLILGVIVAMIFGILFSLIHAFLCISLKSDQVISGIMLAILGLGITTYVGRIYLAGSTSVPTFNSVTIPLLSDVPLIGVFFDLTIVDYFAIITVGIVWVFLYRTNLGLEIRAVGEHPRMADSMGIPVKRRRYLAVLIGGALAGAAGAHISLAVTGFWVAASSGGRGWIAFALVIFSQWRPMYLLGGAYLFGVVEAMRHADIQGPLSFLLETPAWAVVKFVSHPTIMETYPYVATILVLAYVSKAGLKKSRASPDALLEPYIREKS